MKTWNIIAVALLALIPITFAQTPIDAVTGPAQEQMNAMGQELQQKAVQHIVEGNLTQEHISQELKRQINQKVPGFEALIALVGLLCVALVIGRRN